MPADIYLKADFDSRYKCLKDFSTRLFKKKLIWVPISLLQKQQTSLGAKLLQFLINKIHTNDKIKKMERTKISERELQGNKIWKTRSRYTRVYGQPTVFPES